MYGLYGTYGRLGHETCWYPGLRLSRTAAATVLLLRARTGGRSREAVLGVALGCSGTGSKSRSVCAWGEDGWRNDE